VLCPLPTNLQRTRTAKNVQTWKPKEADMTPVTKPFPSEIMLPSLVDETEDEDTTGPGDREGGHVNAIDDEDDDDHNFILARLLCKPTPAINNGDILRVVSFDDEFSETESPQVRHTKALADGGDDELTEIAASSEPEEEDLAGRTAASPRRLDFKEAAGPAEDLTMFDVVPSADALPKTGREYATLMGRVLAESDPDLASRKAECVLHFMLKEYKCGRSKIRPDGGMYNKVMHAYAMQGMPERVEDLLQLMCDEYDGGDELATPNVRHYTTLLLAWQTANVSEAPVRSEAIVAKMHKMYESGTLPTCKPDVITYTSVLHSWSISHRQDAAVRAETLFREMKRRYEAGDNDLRPDVLAYSNLMNAITNSGGFAHAEDILWEMVDEYIKGNESCKPQIRNVNSILAGWAKATAPYAPERAEEIVRRWLRLNESNDISALPDSYTYCLVLKCWYVDFAACVHLTDIPIHPPSPFFSFCFCHVPGRFRRERTPRTARRSS
jgi:pentatricopeptide repeat protein